jgi:hypothetical protein
MPKRSNQFQRLILATESCLAPAGVVVLESQELTDLTTGDSTEIDVLIEVTIGPYNMRVAIECADRSRPIDLTWMRGIVAKYQHLPVHKVVTVSKGGFTKGALKKARVE